MSTKGDKEYNLRQHYITNNIYIDDTDYKGQQSKNNDKTQIAEVQGKFKFNPSSFFLHAILHIKP